jgi:tetratricopeptide (TPR) repeat protein
MRALALTLPLVLLAHAAQAEHDLDWKRPPLSPQAKMAAAGDALLSRARDRWLAADRQRDEQKISEADASQAQARRYAEQAIEKYEQAAKLGPPRADIHYRAYTAARHYLKQDVERTYEKQIEHVIKFREVAPLDPRDFEITEDLCHALAKLARLRGGSAADALYDQGVKEYDKLVTRIEPSDAGRTQSLGTLYSNAAELLMAAGRLDEAIVYYERSVTADPQNELNHYGLAVAYDRDGQVRKGAEAMKHAVARDPGLLRLVHADEPEYPVYFVPEGDKHYYLALAFLVRGDRAEALRRFELFVTQTRSAKKQYLDRAREHIRELKGGHAAR